MSYRAFVDNTNFGHVDDLIHSALGIAGESGEVIDVVKKSICKTQPIDRDKLIDELGDLRWYIELMCIAVDTTLEEIETKNIEKLTKRYALE